jgi:hypothetical protein
LRWDIKFRFVTRTFIEDYTVYGDAGRQTFGDTCEFAPLRAKGRFAPVDGPCVVLFEEKVPALTSLENASRSAEEISVPHKKCIVLIASGFDSGWTDFRGRTIRFSFCQIFTEEERQQASVAFMKLVHGWNEAEEKIQSLLKEIETTDSTTPVYFDEETFMNWLQEREDSSFFLHTCTKGQYPLSEAMNLWPEPECFLKWMGNEGDHVKCDQIGKFEPFPRKSSFVASLPSHSLISKLKLGALSHVKKLLSQVMKLFMRMTQKKRDV